MTAIQHIGILAMKNDGRALEIRDFAPLLIPTDWLLASILRDGGPAIPLDSIVAEVVAVPLFVFNSYALHFRLAMESSANPEHAAVLKSRRSKEVQTVFLRSWNDAQAGHGPSFNNRAAAKAIALVTAVLQTGIGLTLDKPGVTRMPELEIRAVWLRD